MAIVEGRGAGDILALIGFAYMVLVWAGCAVALLRYERRRRVVWPTDSGPFPYDVRIDLEGLMLLDTSSTTTEKVR